MKDVVNLAQNPVNYEAYGYSPAVRSGGFLFVSGQVGALPTGEAVEDPLAQFRKAFENLGEVLEAAGCDFDDIVDVTSFHVEMYRYFDEFATAKQEIFPDKPFPCWTEIGVVNLADPALLLELKVVAKLPD